MKIKKLRHNCLRNYLIGVANKRDRWSSPTHGQNILQSSRPKSNPHDSKPSKPECSILSRPLHDIHVGGADILSPTL